VLAGGGTRAISASYALNGTVGQGIVGPADSASFGMLSGYWQPWQDLRLYLPLVMKNFL
jgi:hypothetical protein